ncbi:hypothetical protein L484_023745 [Morus notabilis]|uniref:Uncharacterized protein n=1 Tax=Morus notabilis TaxID=981085 RepID=W9QYK3_9ROSA|nr:hypothetical protein L484_023745 [Morus notabilis]
MCQLGVHMPVISSDPKLQSFRRAKIKCVFIAPPVPPEARFLIVFSGAILGPCANLFPPERRVISMEVLSRDLLQGTGFRSMRELVVTQALSRDELPLEALFCE